VISNRQLTLVLVMALLVSTLFAANMGILATQDSGNNELLRLLAFVPDNENARDSLSYIDYRALIETRKGAAQPKNYQEWVAIRDQITPATGLLMAAFFGIAAGSSEFAQGIVRADKMAEAIGIDPFTTARSLTFGRPPTDALLLEGVFDPAAIGAKLIAKVYQSQEADDLTLWCSADGCDGMRTDLKSRDVNNPFGGRLGRKQPIAISAQTIFSSASEDVVRDIIKAQSGQLLSLAKDVDFQALAEIFAKSGRLIQAQLFNPKYTRASFVPPASGVTPEELKKLADAAKAQFVPIPAYSLVGFAHVIDDTNQYAQVGMVFESAADAKAAGEVITARIPKYTSLRTKQLLTKHIEDRGGVVEPPRVFASESGKYVLVISIRSPLPPEEPGTDGRYISSSMMFIFLMQSITARDIGWLGIEFM
jgi:hypothetical protein